VNSEAKTWDRLPRPCVLVAIAVTLLPLLYFFPATSGSLIISPDDGVIQNIPFRVAVANAIRGGSAPLWNPYLFCGMPLLAAAQAGILFPLNWFYLLLPAPAATNVMMLSTYMVAALGAYLFARRSGASIAGAAVTSVVWQCGGFMVNQIGHTNIAQTAALLPSTAMAAAIAGATAFYWRPSWPCNASRVTSRRSPIPCSSQSPTRSSCGEERVASRRGHFISERSSSLERVSLSLRSRSSPRLSCCVTACAPMHRTAAFYLDVLRALSRRRRRWLSFSGGLRRAFLLCGVRGLCRPNDHGPYRSWPSGPTRRPH
jgi:hypothetical protein